MCLLGGNTIVRIVPIDVGLWLQTTHEESWGIPHEFPRSHWPTATGQCVKRYLSGGDSSFVLSDYSGLSVSSPGITISPENTIEETLTDSVSEDHCDIFKELRDLKKGNHKKPILCHLNINSLRHKFNDHKPVLMDKLCDILVISETKLDETFNDNLFATKGYKMERKDRNARGGGLMVFYRSDLPVRRIKNFECEGE